MTAPEFKLRQCGVLDGLAKVFAGAGSDVVRIEIVQAAGIVNLRGAPADQSLVTDLQRVLGVELPLTPNRWHGNERVAALWLGPDEWLLIVSDEEAGHVERLIREARPDDPWLSVVDVSHSYTRLALHGPAIRDLLAKGCSLDLRLKAFAPGACAQTALAGSRVLLRALESDVFEVWVRNSFADYLAEWLLDASRQIGAETRPVASPTEGS